MNPNNELDRERYHPTPPPGRRARKIVGGAVTLLASSLDLIQHHLFRCDLHLIPLYLYPEFRHKLLFCGQGFL